MVNSNIGGPLSANAQAMNNEMRIKIRKNSVEPHIATKQNTKQMGRQRVFKEHHQRSMASQ